MEIVSPCSYTYSQWFQSTDGYQDLGAIFHSTGPLITLSIICTPCRQVARQTQCPSQSGIPTDRVIVHCRLHYSTYICHFLQCSKLFNCLGVQCCIWYWALQRTLKVIRSIRIGHSPGIGLPPVAILPWLCRKRGNAIVTRSLYAKWDVVRIY